MDLREKLKFIDSIGKNLRPPELKHQTHNIENYIAGESVSTPFGPCFVRTHTFDKNYMHGAIQLTYPAFETSEIFAAIGKDETLRCMDLKRTIFFDTETTGLSSGTGTHIFLAGFGYFANDTYIVKQFFLRDFNEELALLHAINEFLSDFSCIVSYNGKSYDLPLLHTRYIYSRVKCKLSNALHLDLVHTARRIWKRRLGDCSLQNIEQHILDFHRNGDVPGALIPSIYFQYLRDKHPQPLIPVFEHNVHDIISLAALLLKSVKIFQAPVDNLTAVDDLLSLANSYENLKQWEKSQLIYEHLLARTTDRMLKNQIAFQLSFNYKRMHRWEKAVALWQEIITHGFNNIESYIELAKYYEHILCDYEQTAAIVRRALQFIDVVGQLRSETDICDYKSELEYRLKRITRKAAEKNTTGAITAENIL